ncbi:hypothetical protein HYFRA_00012872 [Hymenoscyphus fraxineus]|uniref:Uncharacterized protein n=1 Tax=Hymenoscyphus fraxineus TaxID=746836 RepID=A0A9N9PTF8_9HELO|nr:hypothetical protein HYFRA_00012872 [Hymenoscyphus fraxineus]
MKSIWSMKQKQQASASADAAAEPNASGPLNKEAAEDLRRSRDELKQNGEQSIRGGMVKSEPFDKLFGYITGWQEYIESWDGNSSQPTGTFVLKPWDNCPLSYTGKDKLQQENASILQPRYSLPESAITTKSERTSFWIISQLQKGCVVLLNLTTSQDEIPEEATETNRKPPRDDPKHLFRDPEYNIQSTGKPQKRMDEQHKESGKWEVKHSPTAAAVDGRDDYQYKPEI